MRILICSDELDHPSQPPTGGIGVFNRIYMGKLSKIEGFSVDYFGLSYRNGTDQQYNCKTTFFRPILYFKFLNKIISNANIFLFPLLFVIDIINRVHFTLALKIYLRRNSDISIVECSDYKGISSLFSFFGIDKHIKLIIRTHGTNTVLNQRAVQKKNLIGQYHERLASFCDNYIYISESSRLAYEAAFGKKENFIICYNGVDFSKNLNKLNLKKYNNKVAADTLTILNFGTQSIFKGIDIINEVCRLYNNKSARFLLAGKLTKDAKKIIDSNDKLEYLGVLKQDELFHLLNTIDICIFPSKFENCPMSWLEAMSRGVPIIVSDIPVSKEIVDNGLDGFICSSVDDYLVALEVLGDDQVMKSFSMQAMNKVENKFSLNNMCISSIEFYNKLTF